MAEFIGANVNSVTLKKQSDVVIKKVIATTATVTLPEGVEVLEPGQVLVSIDNGDTFDVALVDAEANGVLCEPLKATGVAEILLVGVVREKYLTGLDASHKPHLFANKIILK
jgi:hypothetical protein